MRDATYAQLNIISLAVRGQTTVIMTIIIIIIIIKERNRKKSKYKDLELEIQRMWQMKTEVIPVVVGALGTKKKGMVESIKRVSERATVTETQKISMLGSARILRKVFNV